MFLTEKVLDDATMKIEVNGKDVLAAIANDGNIVVEEYMVGDIDQIDAIINLSKMIGAYNAGVTALLTEGMKVSEFEKHQENLERLERQLEKVQELKEIKIMVKI